MRLFSVPLRRRTGCGRGTLQKKRRRRWEILRLVANVLTAILVERRGWRVDNGGCASRRRRRSSHLLHRSSTCHQRGCGARYVPSVLVLIVKRMGMRQGVLAAVSATGLQAGLGRLAAGVSLRVLGLCRNGKSRE